MTSAAGRIERTATLSDGDVAAVRALAGAVEAADGAPALDEQAELRLIRPAPGVSHLLLRADHSLRGYAQLEHGEVNAAELVVGPAPPRADTANALLTAVEAAVGSRPLVLWARGELTPLRAVAEARGYEPTRTLLTMARPLAGLDTTYIVPTAVTVRAFVPGQDDAAWLQVNARAFAGHPEQGRWTQADLDDRLAQPWFDPAGFLLAVDPGGAVSGFHWTKVHPGPPPVAEVYVIGIDPQAQGRGLGRTLLRAGLAHLQHSGADSVILYTEQDNVGAVSLYARAGFEITRRQTQYRRRGKLQD